MGKKIFGIISWIIGIGALIVLVFRIHQIFSQSGFEVYWKVFYSSNSWIYLGISLLLMPVNWSIECVKWYKISRSVEDIGFQRSCLSLLTGLAFGHLLPGRSSEFWGKILFYSEKSRVSIGVLHFINASFQMYVTVAMGLSALFFYGNMEKTYEHYAKLIVIVGFFIILLLSVIIIYADKFRLPKKIFPTLHYQLSYALKAELLAWSVVRYFVFVLQFYFVWLVFRSSQAFDVMFVSRLAVYFLLTSVIPMISIIEVAVRALIGIVVFHQSGMNDIQISLLTTLVWLINLALPSIAGFFIWIYFKRTQWK